MVLPELFKQRMKLQLGNEYEAFLACYQEEGRPGLRINTGKITADQFLNSVPFSLSAVPWTENGFYYRPEDSVTKHPYYHAGLYYIQEPSAMLPASRLPVSEGDRILDLCAAPGGKATELASRLAGTGFLVANDASASRAKALVKNLSLWGCSNFCITGEKPEKLLEAFGCFFDKILVDAPCSGEGMFRKDHSLMESWEKRGPLEYAAIQKEILQSAVQMLKPGGMLLYSTCTFAKEEDEDVIVWILHQYPELELVEAERADGLSEGYPPCEKAIRVWPHKAGGEGHFLALLHKKSEDKDNCSALAERNEIEAQKRREIGRTVPQGRKQKKQEMPEEIASFLKLLPDSVTRNKVLRRIDDQCYLLPEDIRLPGQLRYLRTGLWIGTMKKGRFEPSQSLAMILNQNRFPNVLDLHANDDRVIRYLKGETIDASEDDSMKKGWVLICVDGFALGWGKASGASIKNKYYPGWRLQ